MSNFQSREKILFSVQERDIDLLIIEQLHTCPAFVEWFASKLGITRSTFHSAHHSVYQDNGETDILLFLNDPAGRLAVMIEDKIGAAMQPEQCERYHIRGRALVDAKQAVSYITVLCAPQAYLNSVDSSERWGYRLGHEDIAQWFENDLSPWAQWKYRVLMAATSKVARAQYADRKSNGSVDNTLVELKREYRRFLIENYPALTASDQRGQDREFYIRARGFPPGVRFKHAFFRGEISLIFEKSWVANAKIWLASRCPQNSWLETHNSELHLRMATEVMDPALSLSQQATVVRQALDAVSFLAEVARQLPYSQQNLV